MTMTTTYAAYDNAAEFGSDAREGYPLAATSDDTARAEAAKIATEKGWKDLCITFFRASDGCRGEIDA